jgi:hypothetical protein
MLRQAENQEFDAGDVRVPVLIETNQHSAYRVHRREIESYANFFALWNPRADCATPDGFATSVAVLTSASPLPRRSGEPVQRPPLRGGSLQTSATIRCFSDTLSKGAALAATFRVAPVPDRPPGSVDDRPHSLGC